jgi:hypothetical protein
MQLATSPRSAFTVWLDTEDRARPTKWIEVVPRGQGDSIHMDVVVYKTKLPKRLQQISWADLGRGSVVYSTGIEVARYSVSEFSSDYAQWILEKVRPCDDHLFSLVQGLLWKEFVRPQVDPLIVGEHGQKSWFKKHLPTEWALCWRRLVQDRVEHELSLWSGDWRTFAAAKGNRKHVKHFINHVWMEAKGHKNRMMSVSAELLQSCAKCKIVAPSVTYDWVREELDLTSDPDWRKVVESKAHIKAVRHFAYHICCEAKERGISIKEAFDLPLDCLECNTLKAPIAAEKLLRPGEREDDDD